MVRSQNWGLKKTPMLKLKKARDYMAIGLVISMGLILVLAGADHVK
jgi:hypothetical protein